MKRKELEGAVNELNEVLGLEPKIDVTEDVAALEEDIRNVAGLVEEDDELTIPTTDIIKELTETKKKEVSKPKKDVKKKGKEEKVKVKKKAIKNKGVSSQEKVEFYSLLIEKGKYTRKELVEEGVQHFSTLSESTIRTFLTDAKNPKYSKFKRIVVEGKNGIYSFKEVK